jgi:hypothetical protein
MVTMLNFLDWATAIPSAAIVNRHTAQTKLPLRVICSKRYAHQQAVIQRVSHGMLTLPYRDSTSDNGAAVQLAAEMNITRFSNRSNWCIILRYYRLVSPARIARMDAKRTQPIWLAPALAILGGLLGVLGERAVLGRWGYSGLWAGACIAVAMLITGLVYRR